MVRRVSSNYGPKRQLVNRLTLGVFRNLLARQHLIYAYKPVTRMENTEIRSRVE